jgi:hypothetical protein
MSIPSLSSHLIVSARCYRHVFGHGSKINGDANL